MISRPRCRQCERALLAVYNGDSMRTESVQESDGSLEVRSTRTKGRLLGYGYGASGFFCSITCGHAFAVAYLKENKT